MEAGTRAVIYRRVSTVDQGSSGLGLEAQEAAIRAYCEQRGWVINGHHHDVCSAVAKRRPGLEAALADLRRGDVLVAAKLDRLIRSIDHYSKLTTQAKAEGWMIVAADGSVDLTTPHGKAHAAMATVFAELERDLASVRTREALAAAKARGVRLGGHPRRLAPGAASRIKRWRGQGWTLQRIADSLNTAGTPGPEGARWHPQAVKRVLDRDEV